MRQLTYSLIALVLFVSSISCSKSFLDVEDNTVIIREQYVRDINTLKQYVNGIYILLARDFYGAAANNSNPLLYADLVADNVKPNSNNTSNLVAQYSWNQSVAGSNMAILWRNGYNIIRSCSYAIYKANEFKHEDTIQVNQILGEVYSLRALTHFVLVNTFAQSYNFTANASHPGVPYITSWDWNDTFHRNTVAEVYTGMIDDLDKAIPLLSSDNSNKIIMNKWAAQALLARIYLFKEEWQQAVTLATDVTNAVPLLISNLYPVKLFTSEETEALFQLAPSSTNAVNGSYSTTFSGFYFRGSTFFLATKDIADLLKQYSNDSRKSWLSTSGLGKDSIRKYPTNIVPNFGSEANQASSYYQTLFRSSEMFLTVAEGSAKLGKEETAKEYLDAIRKRADPTAANTTATGTALLDLIYQERRKEFAFEGFRVWDLLRWKQGVNRIDAVTGTSLVLPYPSDKAISPIPMQDVNYGILQNPSY